MSKLWLVIKREYAVRVRSRTFVFSTIGLPLLIAAAFLIPALVAAKHSGHTLRIAIVDQPGGLAPLVERRLSSLKLPDSQPQFQVVGAYEMPVDAGRITNQLRDRVRAGSLDGFLLIPPGILSGSKAEFHTSNPGDFTLTSGLSRAISQAAIGGRLERHNVRVADLNALLAPVEVGVVKIGEQGEVEERGQTFQAAILLSVVLYTSLLLYGIATMRSILEEKSTRIMEVLLSSVRPFQLMAGKILGVGAVGFTQFLIWSAAGALLVGYGAAVSGRSNPGGGGLHLHLPAILWFWFVVYFLGGYFLYSSVYAAVGAAVSNEQDANQAQLPITLVLVLCFTLFPVVVRNPAANIAVVLTMIPFFSPILLMVLRIALETPPLWQILLSVTLLALTTLGVIYVSAKIYRVGVLMYGKRPTVLEIVRWIRYS